MTDPERTAPAEPPAAPAAMQPSEPVATQPSEPVATQPSEPVATQPSEPVAPPSEAAAPASEPSAPPSEQTPTDTRPAVVTVEGVSRDFGDRTVVRDLDLTIRSGTILGVIGPSGAGKTTTVRMLTGALKPTTGEISVLGEHPTSFRRETRERIGYMPQLFTLYPDLTARENVDFVGSLFGLLWRRRRRRVREVLQLLELWDARDRRASDMSGGMQRRLELACALVHEPALLFLDEPTAGIDPILRAKVWDELHRLRDAGRTILVTTQYVGDAEDCDQVALIAGGHLVALAGPDELRQQALGGDSVLVETASMFDASVIREVEGVNGIAQRGPREFTANVTDAAVVLPAIVEAVKAAGTEIVTAQDVRPSFDEIFAILVERDQARADAEASAKAEAPAA
jgi:ABC-2 type transport system ATP-binding protein